MATDERLNKIFAAIKSPSEEFTDEERDLIRNYLKDVDEQASDVLLKWSKSDMDTLRGLAALLELFLRSSDKISPLAQIMLESGQLGELVLLVFKVSVGIALAEGLTNVQT